MHTCIIMSYTGSSPKSQSLAQTHTPLLVQTHEVDALEQVIGMFCSQEDVSRQRRGKRQSALLSHESPLSPFAPSTSSCLNSAASTGASRVEDMSVLSGGKGGDSSLRRPRRGEKVSGSRRGAVGSGEEARKERRVLGSLFSIGDAKSFLYSKGICLAANEQKTR